MRKRYTVYEIEAGYPRDTRTVLGRFDGYEDALRCFGDHAAGGATCELIDERTGHTPPALLAELRCPCQGYGS